MRYRWQLGRVGDCGCVIVSLTASMGSARRVCSHSDVRRASAGLSRLRWYCIGWKLKYFWYAGWVTYYIYGIDDPRDLKIFYVGHTSRIDLRQAQHLEGSDMLSGLTIREIKDAGLEPVFVKLEACVDQRSALASEVFWIDLFRCRGVGG